MNKEELKLKNIISNIGVKYNKKLVSGKIGVEATLLIYFLGIDKYKELITIKHFEFGEENKAEDMNIVAKEVFLGGLESMSEANMKLYKLENSFWKRLKFLFTK